MAPGAPAGRWLLIAFVAGMIAGGGLVAIPLFGAVDQVQDREAELEAQGAAVNATAGQLVGQAGDSVAKLEPDTPGLATSLSMQAERLQAARALIGGVGGGPQVLESLFIAARSLELQSTATGCQAIDPASWYAQGTASLASALSNLSQALEGGQDIDQAAQALTGQAIEQIDGLQQAADPVLTFHEARLQLANATATVHLELQAPVATEGCASLWAWEACPIQPGATPPCASGATHPESAGVIDPGNVTVELTQLPDEAESIEVLLRTQLGLAGVAGCRMSIQDGATCLP